MIQQTGRAVIALHIEAAKQLLRELDAQVGAATLVLGHDHVEFIAIVERRGQMIEELGRLLAKIADARRDPRRTIDVNWINASLQELASAAATALELHEMLLGRARQQRDRLAEVGDKLGRPDVVARQYAAGRDAARPRLISVSG